MSSHVHGTGDSTRKVVKTKDKNKSSIETELVGVSDYIPWTIWAKIFLMGQGYNLKRDNFVASLHDVIVTSLIHNARPYVT